MNSTSGLAENLNFVVNFVTLKRMLSKLGFILAAEAALNDSCPDESSDLEKMCTTDCQNNYAKCLVNCDGDPTCMSSCNRDLAFCEESCPCHDSCFDGCPSCSDNDYCSLEGHC